MGHMFSNWVFVLTGFEEEGTSSGGDVVQTSTQEEREVEEEGCSTCEELKAQITSLVEKNNQLEGRLQVEKDLHEKDMEDLQARYSRTKNEKEKLVEEIKKLKEKATENISPATNSNLATTSESPVLRGLAAIQGMLNTIQVNSKVKSTI